MLRAWMLLAFFCVYRNCDCVGGTAVVGYSHSVRVLMLGSQLATFSERDHLVECQKLCSATFVFLSLVLIAVALRPGGCCSW